jgi:hypothetical protein
MKESIVIEIERDLLLEAFKLADKGDLSLSNYVSSLIENAYLNAITTNHALQGCLE